MHLVRTISRSAIILGLGVLTLSVSVSAESGKDLVGAWMTISAISRDGGKEIEIFGSNPKGIQIFDVSGRFAIIAMRNDLPKIASNNRQTATAEESQKITRGSIAYYGTWMANDVDKTLTIEIESDTFPNFVGKTQTRHFEISGDLLTITNPTGASGGVVTVVLKRAKQ